MALEEVVVKVVLGYRVRNGLVWRRGPRECEGREPVGWRMVAEIAALARTARRRSESGGRASTRSPASIVGHEGGMIGAEYLWGLRRRMRRVLAGCRRLIVGGGNRDLMRAGLGDWMEFDCEGRESDTVLVAAGILVLGRHTRTVAAHFEADTGALGCESLWVSVKSRSSKKWILPGGAPLGPGV